MMSWVSIFSKFTDEALLFEALGIFVLSAGYAALWILRKRKFGFQTPEIPSDVVKSYLNAIIGDAQSLRTQLFGILAAAEPTKITSSSEPPMTESDPEDPFYSPSIESSNSQELHAKIKKLEAKLAEYSLLEGDLTHLKRLQQENAQLKALLAQEKSTEAPPPLETQPAPPATPADTTPLPNPEPTSKIDEDLVSEFEKMLKG